MDSDFRLKARLVIAIQMVLQNKSEQVFTKNNRTRPLREINGRTAYPCVKLSSSLLIATVNVASPSAVMILDITSSEPQIRPIRLL